MTKGVFGSLGGIEVIKDQGAWLLAVVTGDLADRIGPAQSELTGWVGFPKKNFSGCIPGFLPGVVCTEDGGEPFSQSAKGNRLTVIEKGDHGLAQTKKGPRKLLLGCSQVQC